MFAPVEHERVKVTEEKPANTENKHISRVICLVTLCIKAPLPAVVIVTMSPQESVDVSGQNEKREARDSNQN